MKRTIIAMGALTLTILGNYALADEPNTGHTTEVIPGDWDDEDPNLNFNFQDIPTAKFTKLRLHLSCGLPGAKILYTTDSNASQTDGNAWTVYTEPIELTEDCTVRFFARLEGYNDSDIQKFKFVYADYQTAAPDIASDLDHKNIVMETSTPDATIRYTFDNSEPNESSTAYNGPVAITANGTFKARSFANDMFPSVITTYTVDFLQAELPSATFENKHLVLSSSDTGSKFYYTLSDAPVTDTDAWTLYSAPLELTEDCTVRYFASHDGYHDSEVGLFSFFYSSYQVAAPLLTSNPEGTHVVMECETEGAEIRYTTDSTDPTPQSALYSAPVEIVGNGTFRARAFADGLFDSNIVDFIVMNLAVPSPTAVFENKVLVLSCTDANAQIKYTFDAEATPDNVEAWATYTSPIALTEDCTVRFFGSRENFNNSDVQSFSFVYSNYCVADPTIERNPEGTHIVMESSTPNAVIYYTTDGSEPTAKSTLYTEPILIEGNFTFSAIATADGLFDSKMNRYIVSNMSVPVPFASFENLKMVMTCADEKAQIWYTTDSEASVEDTSAWTLYTAPFEMTGDCTLRFFTRRDNFNDSDIESLTFVYSAYQAQAPSIDRNGQGTHIVMTTSVEGGKIHYTTDGSEPTVNSALYEKPIRIQEGAVYRAMVTADNMYNSEISEYIIGNDKLAVPTAAFENFTLVLSTTDEGASIWYTTDPELSLDNVDAWTLYTSPIALAEDCTYRFFAGDDDANASDVQSFVFQRSDYQIALITIERNEEGTHIVMECPTEGAEIRYTTNGSEPTKKSTLYTEPVLIVSNGTFRARAFKEGMYDSEITDFTVANMAVPVAYASFENKLLTLTCPDSKAEIWYTNDDDALPEETENWLLYTNPVALTEDCYVHFFARRDNFNDSDIETFVFLRANYTAATPNIERNEDGRSIIMSTETEGAEIRYTTDGTEPTEESELYTAPIFITQNCTFRARTYAKGLFESAVSEFSVSNMMMMMPYASFENLLLTLSVWDESASVWYTLDPDAAPEDFEAWTLYTEPIALDSNCTVRFFARRGGFLDSQIASFEFVYADYQAAAPVIEREGDSIIMTTETEGAEIRYTTDGTEPTEESALYTEPILLNGNCVFTAKAFADGLFDSEKTQLVVGDMTVANPTAKFENLKLTLRVDDAQAEVWYTTVADADLSDTEAWTLYTEPVTLTEDCTVSYFARRDGFNDSEMMTFQFAYADYQVAAPVIERKGDSIIMTTETEDAEIRYTTDGTEPTEGSALYTEPILLNGNCVFTAKAFADGLFASEKTQLVVGDMTVGNPTAKFENLKLTLSVNDAQAEVWYTTVADADLSDTEVWTLYTEPVTLTEDCTVSYFARRDGFNDSEMMTFEFVYADYQAAAPVIEREGDSIVMTTETEGAEIRYTTDGTEPTEESALYTEPILLNGNTIISAKAFKNDMFVSIVSTLEIADMQVANPYCEFDNLTLVLIVDDPQASIWYTTADNADVTNTEAWTLYTEPLTFTGDCTVSYFARRDGFNDSEVETFVHVYADYQATTPEVNLIEDNSQAEIVSNIEGAEIRFTLDGTEANENSELYTKPIEFVQGLNTIHARVFVPGMYASEEIVFTYTYIPTSVEAITVANGVAFAIEDGVAGFVSSVETLLHVYDMRGVCVAVLNLKPGFNALPELAPGFYLAAGKKFKL